MAGQLYVVSTPIGNLSDITLRALEVLKSVDTILSEDTRETSKLLNHYDISKPQISYRDQNHAKVIDKIITLLGEGSDLALVSDNGTPLISDPGFKLVEALSNKGVRVIPIPGPSAVIAALSASGLPTDNFSFLGFLPKKTGQRAKILEQFGSLDTTLVIYESPFRIKKLLGEINKVLGTRYVCIARELTKLYEEIISGYSDELEGQNLKLKGEFVVMVAKKKYKR